MTATLRCLLAFAAAPRREVTASVALSAATVVCGAGLTATAGYLISRAAERPAVLSLSVAIVGVRFFGLARPVVRYAERLVSHDVALRVLAGVRVRSLARLVPLAPLQLAAYRDGDVLSRMVADIDALGDLHLRGVGPPLAAALAGALCVGVTAAFSVAAAVVLAAGLLVAGVALPIAAARAAERAARRTAQLRGDLAAGLVDVLRAAPELAVYGAEPAATAALGRTDVALSHLARRDAVAGGAADALGQAVTGATVAGVLAVAVQTSADGSLDRALIAALALLALASFEAVAPLAGAARRLTATVSAGERVLDLAGRAPVVRDPAAPVPLPPAPFTVALEGVRARYTPSAPPALDDVSLRVEPGRKVALVGPSGAGKTTVVALLLRFLDPEAGRVTLGGRDLRDLRQDDVRSAIAVAGQDSHLFATTIRENVRVGRDGATDDEIAAAVRAARLADWVAGLPEGLDTPVGERGRELSGGERQRVVLARALLARAPVLVLDEPTAHLDGPTARALMADVMAAAGPRAVLLITHRPEGVDLVDDVVTLDAGRAVTSGR